MGKAFAGSLITHGLVIGLLATSGLFNLTKNNCGSPHASSGSVGVNMVKTIPIPRREGPVNPLANDTKSIVPQAPAAAEAAEAGQSAAGEGHPDPGQDRKAEEALAAATSAGPAYRPPVPYKDNQVYSHTPQAANSPMYGMQGAGGIDIGPASVLGNRFGAYVDLMRDRISQHWNTASVHALAFAEMRG